MFPKQEESRLLVVYHKDGHFSTDQFILINETLCLAELGSLVFLDTEGLSAQYLIPTNNLQRGLNYLNTIRHLGIRHSTLKLSKKRYDAVIQQIKEKENG